MIKFLKNCFKGIFRNSNAVIGNRQGRRHVDDSVQMGDMMLGVDQAGVHGLRLLDVGPRVFRRAIERDRDHAEAVPAELLIQLLPDRQVLAAASPGGVRDQQHLLAEMIRQRVELAREIRQREVRCSERRHAHGLIRRGGA